MTRKDPDFEGCNHSLSRDAAELSETILRTHGNAEFTDKYPSGLLHELMQQGYIRSSANGYKHGGKLVIGKPPMRQRNKANGWAA